ncbi:hypothetical protein [Actinoallomurus sp. CA-150999]|uniref:hypothetical protein n=1 Tax=Actinoallomurus sp. CA-150999 TaxID=3239887 RepID=UPI003D9402F7
MTAAALLFVGVPAADTTTTAPPTSSAYAVSVSLRTGGTTLNAHGFADTVHQTAELTTRLTDGRDGEMRVVAGRVYVHLGQRAPWLSIDPVALGIPIEAIWRSAPARHFTLRIGTRSATTLTIDLAPTTTHPVPVPPGAVDITSYARELTAFAH